MREKKVGTSFALMIVAKMFSGHWYKLSNLQEDEAEVVAAMEEVTAEAIGAATSAVAAGRAATMRGVVAAAVVVTAMATTTAWATQAVGCVNEVAFEI